MISTFRSLGNKFRIDNPIYFIDDKNKFIFWQLELELKCETYA